jgi:osmoprotectant transport system ATP-binding protein
MGDAPAMIQLQDLAKRYPDGTTAVHDLSLEMPLGEVTMLVGPSGCGKTTTLKMINRLIEPTSGRIILDGTDVTHADPVKLRRNIGYVIQNVGLFPHRTIAQNIATVPGLVGWNKKRTAARVNELLELVGLDPKTFAKRYPSQLSGGQRQRIGVARALAVDPKILLMDEPFSAIDPIARDRLQGEFLRLQAEVRKTIVFVTHDVEEAVRVGDHIAVLSQGGHLEQFADPATLLGSPANAFVADFVGSDRGLKRLAVTPIAPLTLSCAHRQVGRFPSPMLRPPWSGSGAVGGGRDGEDNLRADLCRPRARPRHRGDRARRMEAWAGRRP